jgi:hypothetical protein
MLLFCIHWNYYANIYSTLSSWKYRFALYVKRKSFIFETYYLRLRSLEMWGVVVWQIEAVVSEEPAISIIREEDTIGSSETVVLIYRTTRHFIPNDRELYLHCVHNITFSCDNYFLIDQINFILNESAEECFREVCRSANGKHMWYNFPSHPEYQGGYEINWEYLSSLKNINYCIYTRYNIKEFCMFPIYGFHNILGMNRD